MGSHYLLFVWLKIKPGIGTTGHSVSDFSARAFNFDFLFRILIIFIFFYRRFELGREKGKILENLNVTFAGRRVTKLHTRSSTECKGFSSLGVGTGSREGKGRKYSSGLKVRDFVGPQPVFFLRTFILFLSFSSRLDGVLEYPG